MFRFSQHDSPVLKNAENKLRWSVSGISESDADNPVCERIAGTIACVTSTTKETQSWQHELDRRYGKALSKRAGEQ